MTTPVKRDPVRERPTWDALGNAILGVLQKDSELLVAAMSRGRLFDVPSEMKGRRELQARHNKKLVERIVGSFANGDGMVTTAQAVKAQRTHIYGVTISLAPGTV